MGDTTRTLLKAFGIGCLIGATITPPITIALAHYGWNTIAAGHAPFWAPHHRNRVTPIHVSTTQHIKRTLRTWHANACSGYLTTYTPAVKQ